MANTSISNLSAGAAVSATDVMPNVQTAGVGPVKTTAAQLKTFMSDSPTLVTPALGTPVSGNFSTGTFTWPTFNQNTTGTAANVTGVVAAANGGTGQSSYAVGDLLYASSSTAISKLADVATGNALISGGVGVAPSWGKVGLTTHVDGTLPVANGGTGLTALSAGYIPFGGATTYSSNAKFSWDNTNNAVKIGTATLGGLTPIITVSNGTNYWQLGPYAGNPEFLVYNHNNVGMYMSNGGTAWTASSDERLKNITGPIIDAVTKVDTLRTVYFTWKDDASNTPRVGLIAQDVQAVLPEAVTELKGTLGVAYTEVIPLLTAAIKELTARIETLEAKA